MSKESILLIDQMEANGESQEDIANVLKIHEKVFDPVGDLMEKISQPPLETEQYESLKLKNKYRNEGETDQDFYNRITPIDGTQGQMTYDFNTNKYVRVDIDSPYPVTSSVVTIDGITKNKSGVYINSNNEPATEEEILKFEELNILNNIHNEASKLRSNLAGNYKKSDSELLETFDKNNFDLKKKDDIEKGLVNDNLSFDFEGYLNYRNKKLQDGFANFVAKTNAPLTYQHQSEYNALTETKIPNLQEQAISNYQTEIDKIQQDVLAGYQSTIDNTQKQIIAKYQQRANAGENVDLLNIELNKELEEAVNSIYENVKTDTEKALQPIYDKINKDTISALNNDPEVIALDEKYEVKYNDFQTKQWDIYVENWKPKSTHFSEEELNAIGIELDRNGFAFLPGPEKKAMLHKVLSNLDKVQGGLEEEILQEIKNEYWTHFYDKLAFTPTEDGLVYSQFVLKDIATGALKSAQDKLKEEAAKYKDIIIPTELGYETTTAEEQALSNNKHLGLTIDYAQQVLDNPEAASDVGIINFFKGLTSLQGHEYIPVIGGLVDMNKSYDLYKLSQKQNRTKEEEQALSLYAIKNASDKQVRELSTGYNAGRMTGESLGFMGEVILTSGIYSGVKKTVRTAIKNTIDKKVKRKVAGQLDDIMIKSAGRRIKTSADDLMAKNIAYKISDKTASVIAFIASTGAQTSTMPQRYLATTFENMTPEIAFVYTDQADDLLDHIELTALVGSKDDPKLKDGDDWDKAFLKAFGTTWAEYATERMGELLPGLGKSALAKVGITQSPDWLKRMSLGLYLRKMGLNKAEAFEHFAKNQAGWNGILGEMSEEFINIPLSNLINGNDLSEGFEWQNIKEMGISIGASSLGFRGGSVLYNHMFGKTNPTYFVDGQRHADEKSAMAHLKKLQKEGRLNENTDIEIKNDFIAFDNASKFLEDNGLSNEIIKTGGADISEGNIVASEVEILDEINDPKERERLENIDKKINQLEQEKTEVKENEIEQEDKIKKIDELNNQIESLTSERDVIINPIKNKIIKRKKTIAYQEGLANLKSIMEQEGIDPSVLQEGKNEQEVRKLLRDGILKQLGWKQVGDNIVEISTGDQIELTPGESKELERLIEEGMTSHGAFTVDPNTGEKTIIINKEAALEGGGANVAGHEFLHYFLSETLNKHPELKLALGKALSNHIYNMDPRQIRDTDFRARVQTYQREQGSVVAMDETLNILSDAIANGTYQYNETAMTKLGDIIRRVLSSFGVVVEFNEGRDVFNFIRDYNRAFAKGELSAGLRKTMTEGAKITGQIKAFATDYKSKLDSFNEKMGSDLTMKDLDAMGMLFSKDQRENFSDQAEKAKEVLIPYGKDMTNFNPNSDIISKQLPGMIKAQAAKFIAAGVKIDLQELVQDVEANMLIKGDRNFDGRGDLYGHLNGRIRFRILDAFENNPLVVQDFNKVQLDEARAKLKEGDLNTIDGIAKVESETPRTKTNVLKFNRVAEKADEIRGIVKVKKGDTFKEVTDKHAGPVASKIFDVPEQKITDPKKNLTYAKKIKDGIPEPSEAGNIQSFYAVGNSMEKLIKILPEYNVTSDDADINELGENIDVSRETLGRGLGLKNRILKYFYTPVLKSDGKQQRSRGKTSQVPLYRIKPEFVNPTPETIQKAKEEAGITPVGELNNYNRAIGQFLKGLAFFQGQQTALAAAQRNLTELDAPKQRIADITAAMGRFSFSNDVNRIISIRSTFDLETKGIDRLLGLYGNKLTHDIKTKKGRKDFIEAVKKDLLPMFPKEFFFSYNKKGDVTSSIFTASNKNYKLSMSKAEEATIYNEFKEEIFKLGKLEDTNFGKPIDGANWNLTKNYNTIFGNKNSYLEKMKDKKRIEEWNNNVALIHKEMWNRFNKTISKDKTGNKAQVIGTYLKLVANDTGHWHKLGAQIAGYSKKLTKRQNGKAANVEFEHAMPATAAYLYLIDSALSKSNFDTAYDLVVDNYKLIILDKAMDDKLRSAKTKSGYSLQRRMPDNWSVIENMWWERYFNELVTGVDGVGINPNSIVDLDGKPFSKKFDINEDGRLSIVETSYSKSQNMSKAIMGSRITRPSKGITVLDFDDTLATTKSKVLWTAPDGSTGSLNAEEYARDYQDLAAKGYKFDFSEFSKVIGGKTAPLFQKALKLQKKFGPKNMFVLTARPADSATAIFKFLRANGLNIPLKNITGLANSTSEAKALWMADKVAEGYNDFYFADDALQNVQAVKNMLDQFDVKSKIQQAKLNFSNSLDAEFNNILEETTGMQSQKEFSAAKAKLRGKGKGRFDFFIPPSAEDFKGLLYKFLAKGKKGDQQIAWFKKALLDPFARGYRELNEAKQAMWNDYNVLRKAMPDVRKKLTKIIEGQKDFRYSDAVRVYLWNNAGFEIPGLSQTDLTKLTDIVNNDLELKKYADTLGLISKRAEGYVEPSKEWLVGNIMSDLERANKINRADFLAEWIENKDIIFSQKNLNKIEAIYGANFVEALKDMLYRMENGTNRTTGDNRLVNAFQNWINNSVGAIMFFNARSAVLQTLSTVNFINWGDNNIAKAAIAFANQPQFWKDFAFLFNSDMLKQRRKGLKTDVNTAELTEAVGRSKNPVMAALNYLLQKGFLPTQIADSFAISSGGASFYRNRVNTYLKEGLSQKEAETKAFEDFQEIAEETQQSSRPDLISQQQASTLGRLILAFQNTPMQYMRLTKKAISDLVNGRGDAKTNISRILYYGAVQNVIFYSLQSALFALAFDDDEDDEKRAKTEEKKMQRLYNGMLDSILRGTGVGGAVVSTIKNMIIKFAEEEGKGWNKDFDNVVIEGLQLSPPIGSKVRKLRSAGKSWSYNRDVIKKMNTFDLDNPVWDAIGNVVSASTNVPMDRLVNKTKNIREALNEDNATWQRIALMLGWNRWDLNIKSDKIELVKTIVKEEKKQKAKEKREAKKKEEEAIKQLEIDNTIKKEIEEEKEAEKKGEKKKEYTCVNINSKGKRCNIVVPKAGMRCTIHEKVEQRTDGKKSQCKKIKGDGKRCRMQTSNKSGLCYYHD